MKVPRNSLPKQSMGQLMVERCHVGDGYLISSCPRRKQIALMRWNRLSNSYTPVAYFTSEKEAEWFKEYIQEIITIAAPALGGLPLE